MPGVARVGQDLNSGHVGDSTPCIAGSPTVFCNGYAVARIGDPWAPHIAHQPLGGTGSATVFVNGHGASRLNDMTDCGTIILTGSPDTFCGG